ncbi:MAG: hypothetical protein NT121_11415 [Chloroflexi bacterium]|nr:hypothetical protein [Chloroflexota bacterium]
MKVPRPLSFALTGWLAGVVVTVGMGSYWPMIFPAIVNNEHYYGFGPSLFAIIGIAVLFSSPGGLLGGMIGSRIPREGGLTEQYAMAAIMGVVLALPFACLGLWFFTGW